MTQLPGPLVSAAWLAEHLGEPGLRVLEATVYLSPRDGGYDVRSAHEDWAAGHIPGSAFADLIDQLSEPHDSLSFTFPSPRRFAAGMSALGVEDGTAVVVYDRTSTMWATRLWWLLHTYGFENVAVLDGGLAAWEGELTDTPAPTREAEFTPRPHPRRIADCAEVANGPACLINALGPAAFSAARIPGSTSLPSRDLLDASGRFRPPGELRERLGAVGALGGGRVVTYCGGGISATLDAFALTLLGEPDVAVYDGSMGEWTSDPALPLERG
jgi:thiosulfate/3-mercaptopyruvate sulfurtransferase